VLTFTITKLFMTYVLLTNLTTCSNMKQMQHPTVIAVYIKSSNYSRKSTSQEHASIKQCKKVRCERILKS